MNADQQEAARTCLEGAHSGEMTFPEIVGALVQRGFESYAVDFRRETATYYLPSGESLVLKTHEVGRPIAASLDHDALEDAIHEAQTLAPGYTYGAFCGKAAAAGCAGYIVSFSGRRALYLGRTAETHVERFSD